MQKSDPKNKESKWPEDFKNQIVQGDCLEIMRQMSEISQGNKGESQSADNFTFSSPAPEREELWREDFDALFSYENWKIEAFDLDALQAREKIKDFIAKVRNEAYEEGYKRGLEMAMAVERGKVDRRYFVELENRIKQEARKEIWRFVGG